MSGQLYVIFGAIALAVFGVAFLLNKYVTKPKQTTAVVPKTLIK